MKIIGSYKIKIKDKMFGGNNVLLWMGVWGGLQNVGDKRWVVRFFRDDTGKFVVKNSYLEYGDFNILPTYSLDIVSRSIESHSMKVVFEGYPGAMSDVDGVLICNGNSEAMSAYKFRDRISLEDNVKTTVLWRVEVRGV